MTTEEYGRFRITTKKGLTFELIVADWLKEGDYEFGKEFGKVELIEKLSSEQRDDYLDIVDNLFGMCRSEEE